MIDTPNLKLPKYELDDMANLTDGYNAAMDILDGAVNSVEDKFPVTGANIADYTITAQNLANGSVDTNKLATASVTADKIADGAFTGDKFEAGTITTDLLADGAVTAEKLSENSVGADNIVNGSIGTDELANGSVTGDKLSNNSVNTDNIVGSSIGSNELADNSVTNAKIAAQSITLEKLNDSVYSNGIFAGSNKIPTSDDVYSVIASISDLTVNSLSYLKGKNCVWIGDSFTTGVGANPTSSRVSSVFCAKLGMKEFNYGVGSTGWIFEGSSGQNSPYITQVRNAHDGMSAADIENTAMVVIPGTSTDVSRGYAGSVIASAAVNCATEAIKLFPNAIVYVIPMIWDKALFTFTAYDTVVEICEAINKSALPVKLEEKSYTWLLGHPGYYSGDNVHPNNTGYAVWAQKMISSLLGSSEDVGYINSFTSSYGTWKTKVFYMKDGNVIMPSYKITGVSDPGGDVSIGTLPTYARPQFDMYAPLSSGGEAVGYVTYETNGNILMTHSERDATTRSYFNIGTAMWPIYGVR